MKREIFVGNVGIGGDHPVSIQSMTSTKTSDTVSTITQIEELSDAGCDIVRVSVPDSDMIRSFKKIVSHSPIPVIADIHFNQDIAVDAIKAGAAAVRINPGNISGKEKLKNIISAAKEYKIPVRIGVNSGSIEKKYLYMKISKPEKMVLSVLDKLKLFENLGFFDIKISLKSSNVKETIEAYRIADKRCDYPLHIGITEAGSLFSGSIKSAIGIGSLLADGIGNTIRVSLTENPVEEVRVAKMILRSLGLRKGGIEVISCPTCSRVSVDLISIVKEFESRIKKENIKGNLKIAIMGCEVNGPGEAREADIGVAFSNKRGFIFKKGKKIGEINIKKSVDELIKVIKEIV